MRIPAAVCVVGMLASTGAAAQPAPPSDLSAGGRYALQSAPDGVLRVDRQTGATSICRQRGGQWACEAVPDEREALEAEIGRLSDENADLRRRLAQAEGAKGSRRDPELPSREELDRVGAFLQDMMRRAQELGQWLRRELGRDP
jgi:hypothetical protein